MARHGLPWEIRLETQRTTESINRPRWLLTARSPSQSRISLQALSTNIGRITLALAPSSDATLYAAIADSSTTSSNLLGVAKTTNATAAAPTWTQLFDDQLIAEHKRYLQQPVFL